MSAGENQGGGVELRPLAYHEAMRQYLQAEEPEVWQWYASHATRAEHAETVRFELLKSTYRVDRPTQPALYDAAEAVARRLGLEAPITIYQAQSPRGLNASLAYLPDELHVVLHGPVATKLTAPELQALLGHELSHFSLLRSAGGEHAVAEQLLAAMTNDPQAAPPHFASARLFQLYTEIYCDRGALAVADDPLAVIAMLVKVSTDVDEVSPGAFLAQAEEVLRKGAVRAEFDSHPEPYLRALAVKLWADRDPQADHKIRELIEGPATLDTLDLLGQQRVGGLTRRLIDCLLSRPWMRSELLLGHAKLFFEDYAPAASPVEDAALRAELAGSDASLIDYYCFVMLDFATTDRDLDELPLAAALDVSEQLGFKDRFAELSQQEMRLRKKQFEKIDQEKERLLAEAGRGASAE